MSKKINDIWELFLFSEVGSTNDVARELSETVNKSLIVLSENQTKGRGRMGREWISCSGNLYMSQVFASALPISCLPFICAVSVVETLKEIAPKLNINIKWPNDILIDGKKLCGILIEQASGNKIIIGLGLNICASPNNDKLSYKACNLKEYGINMEKNYFIEQYLKFFDDNIKICENSFSFIRQKWLSFAFGLGTEIKVKTINNTDIGIFEGIDEQGFLLLKKENDVKKIAAGDVFI